MIPSPNLRRALTLVEMLVVIGLIGLLAAIVITAVVTARRFSQRVACQENLRQIGQAINQMALSSGGTLPRLEDDHQIPWWANVYRNWEGSAPIDAKTLSDDPANPAKYDNLQLPEQLPAGMKTFKCPNANPLDISSPDNLRRSMSYGLNFDVAYYSVDEPAHTNCPSYKAGLSGKPYTTQRLTDPITGALPCVHDKYADIYSLSQIPTPSTFILVSEANAGDKDTTGDDVPDWTGGRIASDAIVRNSADVPPGRCPIVPRHGGMANILYADGHVDLQRASTLMIGGDTNMVFSNWTLTGE